MRWTYLQSRWAGAVIVLLLAGLMVWQGPSPRTEAAPEHQASGYIYALNNDISGGNSITVFNRASDGSLTLNGSTPIGGLGSVTAFADGTQGSLISTPERTRLFAVDAGSDQISVINVRHGHLTLAGVFPSGGVGPVSLTYADDLLYVLNAANGRTEAANVAGFRVDDSGTLHPIAGATRPLSTSHPNPGQVQLDPSRQYLLVTEKGTNRIDVYRVSHGGSLGAPVTFPAVGAVPFGMAFDQSGRPGEFIVADAAGGANGTGAATAYRLVHGAVRAIGNAVPNYQVAPCWMVVTGDGRFAYTSDADSQAISGYRIQRNGAISLLDPNGVTATTPADTFPLEEAISHNDRFLYVLDSRLLLPQPGPATLSGFHIGHNGSLTPVVDPSRIVLPFSAIGLAAD